MRSCPICVGLVVAGLGVATLGLLAGAGSAGNAPAAPSPATTAAGAYAVDSGHSGVVFRIQHNGAGMFHGMIGAPTGTFSIDPGGTIDVSVKTENINTLNGKRDQHLKTSDFFSAKEFPTLTFKSTSIKSAGDKQYEVAGDLTLHGVTKPVNVAMTHTGTGKGRDGGELVGVECRFTIKRSDFGMNFMQGPLGDEVNITVFLEGAAK